MQSAGVVQAGHHAAGTELDASVAAGQGITPMDRLGHTTAQTGRHSAPITSTPTTSAPPAAAAGDFGTMTVMLQQGLIREMGAMSQAEDVSSREKLDREAHNLLFMRLGSNCGVVRQLLCCL